MSLVYGPLWWVLVSLLDVVVVVNDLHGEGTQRKSQTYTM